MRQAALLMVVALLVLSSLHCRDGGSSDTPTSVTREIGPEGGVVTARDVELDFAPGAFSTETEVTIRRSSDAPAGHIGDAYELLPEGLSFSPPVTARFDYRPSELGSAEPSRLSLARATDGVWATLPSIVDTESQQVMASLPSFSTYAVVIVDGDGDGDGDGDADGDGDGDGDGDADGDGDGDADADCTHETCEGDDTGCACAWTCDGEARYVWCSFTLGQCDCNSDELMDCALVDVPATAEACGDLTCCFR
jgi:hypothetical protein